MFGIDEHGDLKSPIHRIDPRFKLIGFLAVIFAYAYVRDLRMLAAMAAFTIATYAVSKLPFSFWLKRMRYPSFFLIVLVIILILFSKGDVVASLGPMDFHKDGLLTALLIAVRFISILTLGMVLFGTAPFMRTIKAMRALYLPALLADMIMLTFRYLNELGDDLRRMRTAMKMRGFKNKRFSLRGLRTLAWMGGSLLAHSYERSDTVYKAMILRGYGNAPHPKHEFKSTAYDWGFLVVFLAVTAGFVAGDITLGHQLTTLF
ncbi:cobalt ECF transporter T component CbiQ [Chloroflexota bacterium]